MSYVKVLQSIDLGDEVAELDPGLAEVFVTTADFQEIVEARCDLITGIKGSGKSALLLMVVERGVEGVDLVPAQEMKGGAALYEMAMAADPTNPGEDYFRDRWALHTALLVANSIIHEGRRPHARLTAQLSSLALDFPLAGGPRLVWEVAGRLMADNPGDVIRSQSEQLLRIAVAELDELDRSVWVLFDRLDDVYATTPEVERLALRGLLQAHIFVSRFKPRVASKLFLRNDLLDRVTRDSGLRNLDKVPGLAINMNARDVCQLIARRFLRSQHFRALVAVRSPSLSSDDDLLQVMCRILPVRARLGERPSRNFQDWFGGTFANTADGSGKYAPRNILAYLRLALHHQRLICERLGQVEVPDDALLSPAALQAAWVELGANRLRSYVYAEFPQLRPFIERLVHGPAKYYSARDLGAMIFGSVEVEAQQINAVIESLIYCGVLQEKGRQFEVARIYRPPLLVGQNRRLPRSDA